MALTPLAWHDGAWTALRGLPPGPAAEALRQATLERANAIGAAVPSLLTAPLNAGEVPSLAWGAALDALVDTLIAGYLDHTDQDGDWHGSATAPPNWTEATLLSHLGASVRYRVADGEPLAAAWAAQVRSILDALRWYALTPAYGDGAARGVDGVSGRSWADTIAAFDATAWGSAMPGPVGHYAYAESAFFIIKRTRRTWTATVPANATCQLYAELSGDLADINPNPNGDSFDDADYGTPAPGWALLASDCPPDGAFSATIGDFGDATVSQPVAESGRGWRVVGTPRLVVQPIFNFS